MMLVKLIVSLVGIYILIKETFIDQKSLHWANVNYNQIIIPCENSEDLMKSIKVTGTLYQHMRKINPEFMKENRVMFFPTKKGFDVIYNDKFLIKVFIPETFKSTLVVLVEPNTEHTEACDQMIDFIKSKANGKTKKVS